MTHNNDSFTVKAAEGGETTRTRSLGALCTWEIALKKRKKDHNTCKSDS